MVQAMDQRAIAAIEGAMEGTSDGSGSNRLSDGWCNQKQQKERWMVRGVDQGAIEGETDGSSDGSGSN